MPQVVTVSLHRNAQLTTPQELFTQVLVRRGHLELGHYHYRCQRTLYLAPLNQIFTLDFQTWRCTQLLFQILKIPLKSTAYLGTAAPLKGLDTE